MNSETTIIKTVRKAMDKAGRPGVIVAGYLFGSLSRSELRPDSDIDLAFLLDEKAYKSDPIIAMSPAHLIAAKVGMQLDRETDVTILNSASLEMAYEVVTSGKCLFELDLDLRMEYELKIKGMYFDFKPFLEDLRSKRLARI
jgi:predicted nucleotidyltransferase